MENNHPDLWKSALLSRDKDAHKYDNGHAVIYGAPEFTGATRLAACACARVGAGLTSVLAPSDVVNVYRSSLPAHIMVRDNMGWDDDRVSAKLYGSGGLAVDPVYDEGVPTVLDADALAKLPERLPAHYILTPHEGEFSRAFPDVKGEKSARAVKAAQQLGAIIVLKGASTIIAHPDGRIVVNTHASDDLASAGSGDVLAGMITGLLAQAIEPFDAACAGVWMHGEAAIRFGRGMVASDISEIIPKILQDLT